MKIKQIVTTVTELQIDELHPLLQQLINLLEELTGCLVSVRIESLLLINITIFIHINNELDGELWCNVNDLARNCQIELDQITNQSYNIVIREELRPYPLQTL